MSHGSDDERWQRLLTLIEDAGGHVSPADWRRLGVLCNYDPRGLGGFYRGDQPSMEVDGTIAS
jgi:hypothetical protein